MYSFSVNTLNIFISCNENIQIFTCASHSWNCWCFHYTWWKYLWYSPQKSKYPLYIHIQVQINDDCRPIALDMVLFIIRKALILSYFSIKNICCGYSLEASHLGATNESPQHVFMKKSEKYLCGYPLLPEDMDTFFISIPNCLVQV